jgi:hypothetical protein
MSIEVSAPTGRFPADMHIRPLALMTALLGLAAASCSMVDPAVKADLDRRIAQMPTSEQTFAPPESFLPMAFFVGQWTQHLVVDGKGMRELLTYKLVGQDNDGYWLEVVTESYKGREAVKMHVVLLSGRDPSGMEIRALKIKKDNGPATDVDPGLLINVRAEYRGALDLLAASFEGQQQDDAHVPAGRFIGCYKSTTAANWGPWHEVSTVCSHPAVPLSGIVRGTPVGKPGTMELVNFGLRGAESEF